MSTVSISYSSLKAASNEAKSVAKKLDKYADSLYGNVYKKLNDYDGGRSANLVEAKSKLNSKIGNLRSAEASYEKYAVNLIELKNECVTVDEAVRSRVSYLTASFKQAHGIRNSKVENALSYLCNALGNKTAAGRIFGQMADDFEAGSTYLKDYIREWYNYDGGKEWIKGVIVGALEVVIGVLTVIGAIIGGGGVIAMIAGVLGGCIAVANGFANLYNETKAYEATQNNDPAIGRRRSDIDTLPDLLRSSFMYGDNGEIYVYNEFYNGLAIGIDIVDTLCTVVTVVSSVGKLLKNGFKWATGSAAKLKDITINKDFFKGTFSHFKGRILDIGESIKFNGWPSAKDVVNHFTKDIGRNLKKEFWNFSDAGGRVDMKQTVDSVKHLLTVPKDFLKDGFAKGFKDIVLPAITLFSVESVDATMIFGADGQLRLDFTDTVNLKSLTDIFEKSGKVVNNAKNLVGDLLSNERMRNEILDKLSSVCSVDISVPEIHVPDINLPVLRAA